MLRSSQFLVPLPPTSEQPEYSMTYRTHIHDLDNDSLLQIFKCYRLEDGDNWYFRHTWRRLVHVCQRWRYLVYDLPSHLDMRLLLTNDSPSIDTLSHIPPLPLVIDYSNRTRTMAQKDEENIHLGLQQHDRVRRVVLQAPSSSLRMWLESMNKLFPRLVDLHLLPATIEEMNLELPETLQAPDLRHLSLHGIGLPAELALLSSASTLSTLSLTHIGASCYFPPVNLLTRLRGLPHLEELSIGLAIPIPPSREENLLPSPITLVTLPALRRLTFQGEDVYLNNFVSQISTPLLERLSLALIFDLAFTLVNLTEFIHRTEGFECLNAWIVFNKDSASVEAGHYDQRGIGKLILCVNCEPLDWQMDSITQICGALGVFLSTAEELTLDLNVDGMPSDWEDSLDSMMWHELLLPFIGVKRLHIGSSLTQELSQALQSVVLELLPDLQELEVQLDVDHAKEKFSLFLKTRELVGRPVRLLTRPTPHVPRREDAKMLRIPVSAPEKSPFNPKAFLKYMNYVGRSYRYQATSLISIYQTFIQAQEQTFCSYVDLRR